MTQSSAEAIAKGLAAAGCRHAFGMPGGEVLVLLDALEAAGISFTLCKHENAAGFMAEGSWHATGAPGVLLTTIGPGLANATNSVANALQEQVPMIVLSGCIAPEQASQFTHQVIDQSALMAPITKATFQVADGNAAVVIEKALAIALADPPGPVHVDLPDIFAKRPAHKTASLARPTYRSPAASAAIKEAADCLRNAQRPLILSGIGAVLHDAGSAIDAFSAKHEIPVITTYKAKGIVPERNALALGGHGLSPLSDKYIRPLLESSDCVLCLGYDPIEMRSGWKQPWHGSAALEFVHAQIEHGMHGSRLRHVCDIQSAVRGLDKELGAPLDGHWQDAQWVDVLLQLSKEFGARPDWGAHQVFDALNQRLSDDAVVTVDSGAHRILLTQMFHCNRPGHLLQSAAFCTMGVAVPLAIGHKIAKPEVPVVAVVGDAGLDMVAGDLATLRDTKLPLTIVVLVDGSLALISKKQALMQLAANGVDFGETDFVMLAKAYGGIGKSVEDAQSLQDALEEAARQDRFTILACRIDASNYDGAF